MIRIAIATGDRWAEHEPVLEYSIRKNASQPVEIRWLRCGGDGLKPSGCTGFTNYRFAVPEIMGPGYAIYLDVDMLVLGDVADLWDYRKPGKWVCLRDGSTEVSVIDCALRLPPKERIHEYTKFRLRESVPLVPRIPLCWNVKDRTEPGMKLLHFTDLKCQPWFGPHKDENAVKVLHDYQNRYQEWAQLGLA